MATDITVCKNRIQEILKQNKLSGKMNIERVQSFVHVLRIFEVEMLCLMNEWTQVSTVIQVSASSESTN